MGQAVFSQGVKALSISTGLFVVAALFLSSACTRTQNSVQTLSSDPVVAAGRKVAAEKTCLTCHSLTGQPGVGPTFMYLYGRKEKLADGTEVQVDEAYLRESIVNPAAKIVARYAPVMPPMPLTDTEVDQLIALIKSLAKPAP